MDATNELYSDRYPSGRLMKSWIHLSKGQVLRQAHVGLESPGGLKEDLPSRQGFSGRVAVLYREYEPTAWSRIEGGMRPLDLDGYRLEPTDLATAAGHPLRSFYNNDVSIWISGRRDAMPFYARNADGDEVYFVHEGTGLFDTEFGPIPDVRRAAREPDQISRAIIRDEFGSGSPIASH
jgi:homogentisate 1,2-dioxygenase